MPASDQESTRCASGRAEVNRPAWNTAKLIEGLAGELGEELADELDASNQNWVAWVCQRLGVGRGPEPQPDLAQEAAAALAAGDWRRGALLYRQLLRPPAPRPHELRSPGWW